MHKNFADWYRQVSFENNRETLELRWKGLENVIDVIDFGKAESLIRIVYGQRFDSEEYIDEFQQCFKDEDSSFLINENELEVKVLAGCVLAVLCQEYDIAEVAPAILTATACNLRAPDIDIKLIDIAAEQVLRAGVDDRKRLPMSKPKKLGFNKTLSDVLETFSDEPDGSFEVDSEVIKKIGKTFVKCLGSVEKEANEKISELQKNLIVQDEELQILWWMIGTDSRVWNSDHPDSDSRAKPLFFGKEVANITSGFSESPSLKYVFSNGGGGIQSKLSIPDAVNACGIKQLEMLYSGSKICSIIYPLHDAIYRAREINADPSWVDVWCKISGISKDAEITQNQIALQFYREMKLLESTGVHHD